MPVARLTQCRLPQRSQYPAYEPDLPLVVRAVPAFADLHFSGCLNPMETFPSGIVRWDGDPNCPHGDSRMFGQNRMMAWGPVPPACTDRREWFSKMNTMAARFLNEAAAKDESVRNGCKRLNSAVIRKFADEFIARMPCDWEMSGADIVLWVHTGRVPEWCNATRNSRDEAERRYRLDMQAVFDSPERRAERLLRMQNAGLIPAGR